LPNDCVASPACIGDVAKRLGVAELLFVVMVDTGGGGAVQIDSTWVDVASGKSTSRPVIDVATVTAAKERFAAAAHQLLPDAPVRPKETGGGGNITIGNAMSPAVPRHLTRPAMITAGVAVVGLGVGIAFGLQAKNSYHDCEEALVCDQALKDKIRQRSLLADAGFVLALGGAIATGVLYATSGKEPHLIVAPSEHGGVALTAVGRF
jgi:hypothetical protein